MIQALKDIRKIAGDNFKILYFPIFMQVLDTIISMFIFSLLLFTLRDLISNDFTSDKLLLYIIVGVVSYILRIVFFSVSYLQIQYRGSDIATTLRLELADRIRELNLGYFNTNSIGKLNASLSTDIEDFEGVLTHSLGAFINCILFCLLAIIFSATIDIRFTLVIAVVLAIALPLLSTAGKRAISNADRVKNAINGVVSRVIEYISGIKTFKLYNITGEKFERMDNAFIELRKASISSELRVIPWSVSFSTVTSFLLPIGLIIGSYFFKDQAIDAKTYISLVLLTISISNMASTLGSLYPQFRFLSKASKNILALLGEETLTYTEENVQFENYDIAFKNVSFEYVKGVNVLNNLNFEAKQGSKTALIGPSGSGKSTVVNLISRFWDVNQGTIEIGGHIVRNMKPDDITKEIAVVFQNVYLLHDTFMNNIKMNNPKISDEDVIQACKDANCYDFIMAKENGFDTLVGEGGSTLSGGEKQRISIARALAKNAPIVLLDESTSNLDGDNEYEITESLNRLMKNKTCFVIAHRLQTIQDADNILVLDDGNIIEQGNHSSLLKQGGYYKRMYDEQQKAQNWTI